MEAPITFWQNMPSMHQVALLTALAKTRQVTLVTENALSDERSRMGWVSPAFDQCDVLIAPPWKERRELIHQQDVGHVNIFSGIAAYPETYRSLRQAVRRQHGRVGIYSEPWAFHDRLAPLRAARHKWHAALLGRKIDFVLATGDAAVAQQTRIGMAKGRVYEFGYFVDPTPPVDENRLDSHVELFFLGTLESRKGLDTAIRALSRLGHQNWRLTVVGDGSQREAWQDMAESGGIGQRIHFIGSLPNDEARSRLSGCDVLLLPSRYDGWGAVVNEALLAGARVLVTESVGSSALVTDPGIGAVVRVNDEIHLRSALEQLLADGPVHADERAQRREECELRFGGASAAAYLLRIVANVNGEAARPLAPWRGRSWPEPCPRRRPEEAWSAKESRDKE